MKKTVFCLTLGCDKNLVDSEALLGLFQARGVESVPDPTGADFLILNTCGFIAPARLDSEETLAELADLKDGQVLVVCGCWSQEHGELIRDRFPQADIIAGVGQGPQIVEACLNGRLAASEGDPGCRQSTRPLAFRQEPGLVAYQGMLGRPLLTPDHLAFVKLSEGCSCHCTFCRIPLIRGPLRSRPPSEILAEVHTHVARGVREIQLISQNSSDFGRDAGGSLHDLVAGLSTIEELRRIRLLYLYPGLISARELLDLLALPRVVPYLDLPIQHASARLLCSMRRPGADGSNLEFVRALRRERPDLVLRTTVLLGFPGEEEEDVSLLADFLAQVEFDHVGTYRYSPEVGTPAADMDGQVPFEVVLDREAVIMDLQAEIALKRQEARLGTTHEVVVDEVLTGPQVSDLGWDSLIAHLAEGSWADEQERSQCSGVVEEPAGLAIGRSYHFGYDLDGVVALQGAGLAQGQWIQAEFRGVTPFDVWAEARIT